MLRHRRRASQGGGGMRMGLLMNIRTIFLGLAAFGLAFAAPLAQAQTARPGLDAATASTIIAACEAYAVEHELQLTIAVFDEGANLQGLLRMDGAILASLDIAQWKGRTAANLGRTTGGLGEAAIDRPAIYHVPGLATLQGGVPIRNAAGVLIGGVGASGAASDDDEACAMAGIEAAGLTYNRAGAE